MIERRKMVQSRLRALVLIAGLLAVFALVAACGGDDGDGDSNGTGGDETNGISSPNLEEYFETVEAAVVTFEAEREAAADTAAAANLTATSEEEELTVLAEFATEAATIYDEFVNKLKAIREPDEVKEAHEDVEDAGEDVVETLEELAEDVEKADTAVEANELFDDAFGKSDFEDFGEACRVLQGIADENDIVTDLLCPEEEAA